MCRLSRRPRSARLLASKLREEVLALKKTKLGLAHPDTLRSMLNLALSYLAAGRLPACARHPGAGRRIQLPNVRCARRCSSLVRRGPDTRRDAAIASSRVPRGPQTQPRRAEPGAGASRPSIDPAELEAVLALGRTAVDLNKGEWELLALGMAEHPQRPLRRRRRGPRATETAGKEPIVAEIAAFDPAQPVPARQERPGPRRWRPPPPPR